MQRFESAKGRHECRRGGLGRGCRLEFPRARGSPVPTNGPRRRRGARGFIEGPALSPASPPALGVQPGTGAAGSRFAAPLRLELGRPALAQLPRSPPEKRPWMHPAPSPTSSFRKSSSPTAAVGCG
ncbi:hypothetical protein UM91_08955 [Pseudomonas oryzihabitans]|nr:hypothetical protein UM91_08955 [Pseudomonas oryzihabitans]